MSDRLKRDSELGTLS